jgi:hypothetical protein
LNYWGISTKKKRLIYEVPKRKLSKEKFYTQKAYDKLFDKAFKEGKLNNNKNQKATSKMDKKQWQDLYNQLDTIYSDFYLAYPLYENGSNKQKRKEGEQKVDNAIHLAEYHLSKCPEAIELLTNGNPFLYDEFLSPRYFKNDMPNLLQKIKEKIESID